MARNVQQNVNWVALRKDVTYFLHYLKVCFSKLNSYDYSQTSQELANVSFVLDELRKLCVFVGRVAHCEALSVNDAEVNYFHLCLDIWWQSFELAHVSQSSGLTNVDTQLVCDGNFLETFASQLKQALLVDLVALCLRKFTLGQSSANPSSNPFVCDCVQELFIMCRHVTRKLSDDATFWKSLNEIITESNQAGQRAVHLRRFSLHGTLSPLDDRHLFTLWLSAGISKAFKYNEVGDFCDEDVVSGNDTAAICAVHELIKCEENSNRQDISHSLRRALCHAVNCCELWESNIDLVLPFVEYYMKRINKADVANSSSDALHIQPKTSVEWHRRLTAITGNATSGEIFDALLKLFDVTVRKLHGEKSAQTLAQLQRLKGRLYSKIQPRRLEDLSGAGLYKFLTFFLVFENAAGDYWSELGGKVCDIAKIISHKFLDHSKTSLVFRCLFTQLRLKPDQCDYRKTASLITVIADRLIGAICTADVYLHSKQHDTLLENFFVYLQELRLLAPSSRLGTDEAPTQNQTAIEPDAGVLLNRELTNMLFRLMEKLIVADAGTVKKIEDLLQIFFQDMRQNGDSNSWIR